MLDELDPVARGARVQRLDAGFRWPGGRHVAVVFNLAYEAWSDGIAPGIGPMGNPLPPGVVDTNAISWANYGATRGIHAVKWGVATQVVWAWVLTIPASAAVAAASWYLFAALGWR